MSASDRITIVGGGPWGMALARAARRGGGEVTLYSRRQRLEEGHGVRVTDDLAVAAQSKLLVLAVPTTGLQEMASQLGSHLDGSHLVVHGVRGLSEKLETMSDVLREQTPVRRIGALGGPVQAAELTEGRPSAMVCGSHYPEVCRAVSDAFHSEWLRVYPVSDLRGVEWASALVGTLAIGVGFAEQAGAGPGLLAALISRAMDDAARLAAAAGADPQTLQGLAGYGDLLASLALKDRPEVVIGRALARGASLDDAVAEAHLRVEGISLIPRVVAFAKEHRVSAPAFEGMAAMLAGGGAEEILHGLL